MALRSLKSRAQGDNLTLLRLIQDETLLQNCDVAALLRKCKVFAARLSSADLGEWADHELNGYPPGTKLPPYRILQVSSKGHFSGPFGSGLRNADIPLYTLPEPLRTSLREAHINQSIGALQETLRASSSGSLQIAWPQEVVGLYGQEMSESMGCIQAWKVIPVGSLHNILELVKNRVLDFTLELQRQYPELMSDSTPEKPAPSAERVNNVFNTTVYGSVGSMANASSQFQQTANLAIGDIDALRQLLRSQGVPDAAAAELEKALQEDKADAAAHPKSLGQRALGWMGKLAMKAGSGAWAVTQESATKIIPAAIAGYLGIDLDP